ncbi:predicted protein [Nematostella vectensis]|uniref:Endonuclease/exonuclease/phosphatase domain-containing protein n=1 Tax=Nematostella vectensis TaxID=45351 RepID=A7SWT8_NEMVE|nr:predicted protein [Nematostella vectensis]|eukprot:XP_001623929.1 predicted protein [Nematostella vectensis]
MKAEEDLKVILHNPVVKDPQNVLRGKKDISCGHPPCSYGSETRTPSRRDLTLKDAKFFWSTQHDDVSQQERKILQVNSCEILPQDFLVYRKDRPSHKGGVLIAVKNNLVSIPPPDLDSDCEILWCEVLLDKETILLGSYYRQESLGMISLDALDNSLSKVTKLAGNRHVILTGDFNLQLFQRCQGARVYCYRKTYDKLFC